MSVTYSTNNIEIVVKNVVLLVGGQYDCQQANFTVAMNCMLLGENIGKAANLSICRRRAAHMGCVAALTCYSHPDVTALATTFGLS